MSVDAELQTELKASPKNWLITGVAGFIGSSLLEALLKLDQSVAGLDNFSTGKKKNLDEVRALVSVERWGRFRLLEGDISNLAVCRQACTGMDLVLHQAALGSVPLSMIDPVGCHQSNVTGFLNMLVAARDAGAVLKKIDIRPGDCTLDMEDLERQLKDSAGARFRLVVTDGVFSMDGYLAPLSDICELAERHEVLQREPVDLFVDCEQRQRDALEGRRSNRTSSEGHGDRRSADTCCASEVAAAGLSE